MMKAASNMDVRARRMFNGMGIYAGECMFAFLKDEDIGLKLSPEDAEEVLKVSGAGPFRTSPNAEPMKEYVKLPPSILDDFEKFSYWVQKSAQYAQQKSCAEDSLVPELAS
jgi:DNA transformation protein